MQNYFHTSSWPHLAECIQNVNLILLRYIAIMELREGTFAFVDNYQGTRTGTQCLFPMATVLNGKRTPPRM